MLRLIIVAFTFFSMVAQAELLARWDFDDTAGGTFTDRSGTYAGVTGGATSVDGVLGNALYFDGTQRADIAFNAIPDTNFTISFWAKVDPLVDQGFFSYENDTGDSYDRQLGIIDGEGYARVWNRDSIEAKFKPDYDGDLPHQETYFTLPSLSADTWHHWTMSVELGVGSSIYIDGNLVSQRSDIDRSDFDWGTHLFVGYDRDIGRLNGDADIEGFTIGAIDELAIYDNAMDEFEVRAINDVPVPTFGVVIGLLAFSLRRTKQ